jgi:copper transport protein
VLAGSASAHATLVASDPADGARLKTAPKTVTITFDEQVGLGSLGYLHVTNQSGQRVDARAAYHPGNNGTKIADDLKSTLPDGTYTESYRVISADSHPVAGVVRFVVGNGALSLTSVDVSATNKATSVIFDVVRWVSYAGIALLGGFWLVLTVWPEGRDERRARAIIWTGWAAATVGAAAELLMQGPYASGEGPSALGNGSLLDATLHTSYGEFHCARLVLLGALALLLGGALQGVQRGRSRYEDAVWPLAISVVYTFSAVGHASTTNPAWLSIAADVVHLTAMATWVGGLAMLVGALLPRREPAELRDVLPVFSRLAFASVVALAVTGTYAAWRGIGALHAILHTNYGLLVGAKVLLFVGLVSVGNLSRRVIQRRFAGRPRVAYAMTDAMLAEPSPPAALPPDEVDVERVRRGVVVEIALAALVLTATSVLVAQPRGREALAVSERQPVSATASLGGGRTVTVTVDPGTHGTVSADVALSPGAQPQSVTATAGLQAKELGPIPVKLAANGHDLYSASGLDLPAAGTWTFTLVVTTSKFDAVTTDVKIYLY